MAISLTTARSPRISFDGDGADYRPGACNIGTAEIRRRRRFGHIALVATLGVFLALVVLAVPPIVRFVVALPAAVAAACYLEAALKFCIGFGWLGLFNFTAHGSTQRVSDGSARATDRRRALWLSVATALIGIAVGTVAVFLPL
jgi:hypothetical protein